MGPGLQVHTLARHSIYWVHEPISRRSSWDLGCTCATLVRTVHTSEQNVESATVEIDHKFWLTPGCHFFDSVISGISSHNQRHLQASFEYTALSHTMATTTIFICLTFGKNIQITGSLHLSFYYYHPGPLM